MSGMAPYLRHTPVVDWRNAGVSWLARRMSSPGATPETVSRRCVAWIQENIRHSWRCQMNPVTCRASDVLWHRTGYCYAISHLLAALVRANGIPAGFRYQRVPKDGGGYCLHGLNAVRLPGGKWVRLDASSDVGTADDERAVDLPGIWPDPPREVTAVLRECRSYEEVYARLPDAPLSLRNIPLRRDDGGTRSCPSA